MDVNMDLTMDLQIYKTGMITVLSNYLIQQHNANRLTRHITMEVVSEDSSCSMAGWGTLVACAEVSTGSVEDSNAKHGQQLYAEEVSTFLVWKPRWKCSCSKGLVFNTAPGSKR
jgi:hypothetical protein